VEAAANGSSGVWGMVAAWWQRGGMVGALVQPCDAYQSIFNQTSCACHASLMCDSHVIHCRCTVQINNYYSKVGWSSGSDRSRLVYKQDTGSSHARTTFLVP
jgi:hypothetical protein